MPLGMATHAGLYNGVQMAPRSGSRGTWDKMGGKVGMYPAESRGQR